MTLLIIVIVVIGTGVFSVLKVREDDRQERDRQAHKAWVASQVPHVFSHGVVAGELLAMGGDPAARASYDERNRRYKLHEPAAGPYLFDENGYDRYLQMKDRELFRAFEDGLKAGRQKHEDPSLKGLTANYDPDTHQVTWAPSRFRKHDNTHSA